MTKSFYLMGKKGKPDALFGSGLLLTLVCVLSFVSNSFAQLTVSATGTNGTCASDASVAGTVANATGTVAFRLLNTTGDVIRNFQSSGTFNNLPAGSYVVSASDNVGSASSSTVSVTTSYVPMTLTINNATLNCSSSVTTLTVNATGGKGPYVYAITAGPVTRPAQSSPSFGNLGPGTYTFSVTDACNSTVTAAGDITVEGDLTAQVIPWYNAGFITYGHESNRTNNMCATGTFVRIDFWMYKETNQRISAADQAKLSWRYEYPAGSGMLYGEGGVLNAPPVPVTTLSLPMPATAVYPYSGSGRIVLYNQCGNATFMGYMPAWTSQEGRQPIQTYICGDEAFVKPYIDSYTLTCMPVYYQFTDEATGVVKYDTLTSNRNDKMLTGFEIGHTYRVLAVDANGNNALQGALGTYRLEIPRTSPSIRLFDIRPTPNALMSGEVLIILPVAQTSPLPLEYRVIASSSGTPAVGYTKTIPVQFISGVCHESCYWPSGTYTIVMNAGCFTDDTLTFTIPPRYNASLAGETVSPICGGFDLAMKAKLDFPNSYTVKIMPGSTSGVGLQRSFSTAAGSGGIYTSDVFAGLGNGTYVLGLYITGGNVPVLTQTVTYDANNALSIDPLKTGGYTCPGTTTGNLVVTAISATGSPIRYSMNGGVSYQDSNVFTGVAIGNYPVSVIDTCGNVVSYQASVIAGSDIQAMINGQRDEATVCEGQRVNLTVNLPGASSYAWTGPNFASSIQNPVIAAVENANAGIYLVSAGNGVCVLSDTVRLIVRNSPVVAISTTCTSTSFQLRENGTPANSSWSWSSSDAEDLFYPDASYSAGSGATTSALPAPFVRKPGTYSVSVTGTNGCTTVKSIEVKTTDCESVLPVTLAGFSGVSEECSAFLKWKTSEERNFDRFDVQQSADGIHFTTISVVNSNRNTSGSAYSGSYAQVGEIGYYRLKMVDLDGSFAYSRVISIKTNCSSQWIKIHPNPFDQLVNVRLLMDLKSEVRYELSDVSGHMLMSGQLSFPAEQTIQTKDLRPGMYILRVTSPAGQWTKKVVKN